MSEITRLSGDYNRGYTAALLKMQETLEAISGDMKQHKIPFNKKNIIALVKSMIDGRMWLRDDPNAFARCNNNVEGGFEVYSPRKNKAE